MKLIIDIDDTVRAFTKAIALNYFKVDRTFDPDNLIYHNNDIFSPFPFEDEDEKDKFLYIDYPFEVFAAASTMHKNYTGVWNIFQEDILEDIEDLEIIFSSNYENHLSLQATYFFLSKTCCRCRKYIAFRNVKEVWDNGDVVITANPQIIKNAPQNKKVIKIDTEYNKDVITEYQYDSIVTLCNNGFPFSLETS